MTSNKTYPGVTNGGDSNAWVFGCLAFDKTGGVKLDQCNTYWGKANQRVKCVQDTSLPRMINLTGLTKEDFVPNNVYQLKIENKNVVKYNWDFVGLNLKSNNNSYSFTPKNDGCYALNLTVLLFGGVNVVNCFQYFVTSPYPNYPNKTKFYEFSAEEEVINGANYGRLLSTQGVIWLTSDVATGATTGSTIPNKCPTNYRPPDQDDVQNLLKFLGAEAYYILTRIGNYSTNFTYMMNTKRYSII